MKKFIPESRKQTGSGIVYLCPIGKWHLKLSREPRRPSGVPTFARIQALQLAEQPPCCVQASVVGGKGFVLLVVARTQEPPVNCSKQALSRWFAQLLPKVM